MTKKWGLVALIAVVCIALGVYVALRDDAAIAPSGLPTLRVPDTRFMGILPLYVAEEKGFFEKHGVPIEWIDITGPGQAGRMFFAGQADLMMTTFANLVPAEVRQPGTVKLLFPIYESAERPGSYILARPDSDMSTVNDLRGKSLGTYAGPSQKAYALMVLRKLGYKEPEDVRLVQVGSSAQVQALFGGTFDALFTVETYGSTAISKGAKVIAKGVRTKYISDPFWLGSAAMPASLTKKHPKLATRVLRALADAADYIEANEAEAREILARRTKTQKAVADVCALYTWVAHPTPEQAAQIQEHVDLLVAEDLIDESLQVSGVLEGIGPE